MPNLLVGHTQQHTHTNTHTAYTGFEFNGVIHLTTFSVGELYTNYVYFGRIAFSLLCSSISLCALAQSSIPIQTINGLHEIRFLFHSLNILYLFIFVFFFCFRVFLEFPQHSVGTV